MSSPSTIVVLTPGGGHAERLLPLVALLAKRGVDVQVMTRGEVRPKVEAAGGSFHDLFESFPIEAVDGESIPLPSRFVTFAAAYAERLADYVARFRPAMLVYDSFVVAAPLVGRRLGIPYVSMRAGHAQVPVKAIAEMQRDPRVSTSPACRAAVDVLRRDYGMAEASPFSYLDGVSPYLNLYPEPPAFIETDVRAAFEPVAFFGSLAPDLRDGAAMAGPFGGHSRPLRVYVSFGTVIWRYYADIALDAMRVVSEAVSTLDADCVVSLGNHAGAAGAGAGIARHNVQVERYVDQWSALKVADVFVTHHGLNSTHEAVFHRVPMLSYPFFGDQPAMAARCQDLGLAEALTDSPRVPLDAAAARSRITSLIERRRTLAPRLDAARQWEIDTIAGRDAVVDRMLNLN